MLIAVSAEQVEGWAEELAALTGGLGHLLVRPEPWEVFADLTEVREDAAWNAFWRIDPCPDGSPAPDGPLVRALEDKFELIAAGQAVAIVPGGLGADRLRPDLTTIPLYGVEPSHVVLATRANDRSRLLASFQKVARTHLTGRLPASREG